MTGGTRLEELIDLFDHESRLLAERLRDCSPTRFAAAVPVLGTRTDAAHHLVQYLAMAGQGVEERQAAAVPAWRSVPRLHAFALADQLTVVAHDLRTALADVAADEPVWSAYGERVSALVATAGAIGELLLHRHDIDDQLPGPRAAARVLAVLDPAAPPAPRRLVVVARRRCPAYLTPPD